MLLPHQNNARYTCPHPLLASGRSLTKKKKCSCTQVSQKCPRALHVFHYWFLVPHVLTHGFPTVQPLVPIPSGVQSLNHLFLPPHVFKDSIQNLRDTLHNSKQRRAPFFFNQMKCRGVRPPECSIAGGTAYNPYNWYTRWKCTLPRSIRSPFAFAFHAQPMQMERNSILVQSCILPLSMAFNTASST